MNHLLIKDTRFISEALKTYFDQGEKLKDFYAFHPQEKNWEPMIQKCLASFTTERAVLVDQIQKQMQKLTLSPLQKQNLEDLRLKNTLTLCTGHQLNLFSGPFFSIIKVAQTILLAEQLRQKYAHYHFVPVYWMAAEGHDWEEIRHFSCFDRSLSWAKESGGKPVGRLGLEDFGDFEKELQTFFSAQDLKHPLLQQMIESYKQNTTLAGAHREIFHHFFAEKGLLILDGDDPILKSYLQQDIEKELQEQSIEKNLTKNPFPFEKQVNPRPINLFYFQDNVRLRVEKKGNAFVTLPEGEKIKDFTPANFSPNVLLRTVYQQRLLPNLVYIGGPAEILYWLQMHPHFVAENIFFPILLPRVQAFMYRKNDLERLHQQGFSTAFLLQHTKEEILQAHKHKSFESSFEFDMPAFLEQHQNSLGALEELIRQIDPSLTPQLSAKRHQFQEQLKDLYKKLEKTHQNKNLKSQEQLEKSYDFLFPAGALRERKANILELVLKQQQPISFLFEKMDPLNYEVLFDFPI